ncbi:MAG: PASTA domain-containing protein [Chitinophagia bacterium]|nr:PASTA domain-containing protein [Chitinophagia bacterium]
MATKIRQEIGNRVRGVFIAMCCIACFILFKIIYFINTEGEKLRAIGKEQGTKTEIVHAKRGSILTEDGHLLSTSTPYYEVQINFSQVNVDSVRKNMDAIAGAMASILGGKTKEGFAEEIGYILKDIAMNDTEKCYIPAKEISYNTYQLLAKSVLSKAGIRNAVYYIPKNKREFPYQYLGSRTIGSCKDSIGVNGLEKCYDSFLKGRDGKRKMQYTYGKQLIPARDSNGTPAQDGFDVVTTLDMELQDVAEHALYYVLDSFKCTDGTCIVLETATGKIRAMVNLGQRPSGAYEEDYNYALKTSEPGSVIKLATMIALLNDKCINVDNTVDVHGGGYTIANQYFEDSHKGLGVIPIWQAFAVSSNVGMAWLANNYYGYKHQKNYAQILRKLHIEDTDIIDFRLPEKPYLNSENTESTVANWAYGYKLKVSPLSLAMLYNAIANNGKMMKPYLVHGLNQFGKPIKIFSPTVLEEDILSKGVLPQLRKCLEAVVTCSVGTAHNVLNPYYTIAGKTGTAKVYDAKLGYEAGKYLASFIGYLPADKPKYTIAVAIHTKSGSDKNYYGADLALPVFKLVADKIFVSKIGGVTGSLDSIARGGNATFAMPYAPLQNYYMLYKALNKPIILPQAHSSQYIHAVKDSSGHSTYTVLKVSDSVMPNVLGMGLKDAVYLLESHGLRVSLSGMGKVSEQSIAPGVKFSKGQSITLKLS